MFFVRSYSKMSFGNNTRQAFQKPTVTWLGVGVSTTQLRWHKSWLLTFPLYTRKGTIYIVEPVWPSHLELHGWVFHLRFFSSSLFFCSHIVHNNIAIHFQFFLANWTLLVLSVVPFIKKFPNIPIQKSFEYLEHCQRKKFH